MTLEPQVPLAKSEQQHGPHPGFHGVLVAIIARGAFSSSVSRAPPDPAGMAGTAFVLLS